MQGDANLLIEPNIVRRSIRLCVPHKKCLTYLLLINGGKLMRFNEACHVDDAN